MIRDPHAEIAERGHAHRATVHVKREERTPPALARTLGLEPGYARVPHADRPRGKRRAAAREDRYVNPACVPDYLSVDFTQTSPTQYLLATVPHWDARYSVEARAPTLKEARLLRIGRDEPCLVVVRRTRAAACR